MASMLILPSNLTSWKLSLEWASTLLKNRFIESMLHGKKTCWNPTAVRSARSRKSKKLGFHRFHGIFNIYLIEYYVSSTTCQSWPCASHKHGWRGLRQVGNKLYKLSHFPMSCLTCYARANMCVLWSLLFTRE